MAAWAQPLGGICASKGHFEVNISNGSGIRDPRLEMCVRIEIIRKEMVRFDTFRFRTFRKLIGSVRFGSVRFGNSIVPVRRGSACVVRTRRGSVRFASIRFRVRFRPFPELNGSVWFGSGRPVRFGFIFLPGLFKIHQRRVQWKQGVVIQIMSHTSLLSNTTPIHCTPLPLHPHVMNTRL